MMNRPPIDELEKKAGCRYLLVSAVSKRARQLLARPDKPSDDVALTMAVDELESDLLKIREPQRHDGAALLD